MVRPEFRLSRRVDERSVFQKNTIFMRQYKKEYPDQHPSQVSRLPGQCPQPICYQEIGCCFYLDLSLAIAPS